MSNVRQVRVTRPEPMPKIRMMRDDMPLAMLESGMSRSARSRGTFPHRESVDKRTGFVWAVTDGRVPSAVNEHGNFVCDKPTSAPNADDLRAPNARDSRGLISARSLPADEVNGRQATPRRVRTEACGQGVISKMVNGKRVIVDAVTEAPVSVVRGIRMKEAVREGAKPKADKAPRKPGKGRQVTSQDARDKAPATRTTKSDVELFAAAHGIPKAKLADKRVVAAIRDLMAHRASVAAYAAK